MGVHKLAELSYELASHVGDQVTHGTLHNLSKPSQAQNTTSSGLLDGTGKQMLNLVARSATFKNSKTLVRLSPLASKEIHSDTLIEFGVRICQLRRPVTFRRFVLRANVALEFTRSSDRNLVGSTNSQNATKLSPYLDAPDFCEFAGLPTLPHWVPLQELAPLQAVFPRGTHRRVWLFQSSPSLHLRLDGIQSLLTALLSTPRITACAQARACQQDELRYAFVSPVTGP